MEDIPRRQQFGSVPKEVDGYKFRSDTEARWYHYFKAIGEPLYYEPDSYWLPGIKWYIPDFYLINHKVFVEVKGPIPSAEEQDLCQNLAIMTGEPVLLVWGRPGWWLENGGVGGSFYFQPNELGKELGYIFDICPACDRTWLRKISHIHHVCGKVVESPFLRPGQHTNHPVMLAAARAAMSASLWQPKD